MGITRGCVIYLGETNDKLTNGREYEYIHTCDSDGYSIHNSDYDTHYVIVDDGGFIIWGEKSLFITKSQVRENSIKNLLND